MIRYALICEEGHGFEAWFGTSVRVTDKLRAAVLTTLTGSQ